MNRAAPSSNRHPRDRESIFPFAYGAGWTVGVIRRIRPGRDRRGGSRPEIRNREANLEAANRPLYCNGYTAPGLTGKVEKSDRAEAGWRAARDSHPPTP